MPRDINLKDIIKEKDLRWMIRTDEILDIEEEYGNHENNFQKIKHKPKHLQNEITEFQSRKKKSNRIKRGK